jgi:hypothetical protein
MPLFSSLTAINHRSKILEQCQKRSDSVQDPNPCTTKYQVISKKEKLGTSMYDVCNDQIWLANQARAAVFVLSIRTASKPSRRAAFGRLGDSDNAGNTWYDTLGDHAEGISTAPLLLDLLRSLSGVPSLQWETKP